MAETLIDGIETHYEVVGSGEPLLMFSPGGFDATLDKWRGFGVYAKTRMLDHLSQHYRCIVFDRREAGRSGGRVEQVTWAHYVAQGKGLLDHLGIGRAHLMGGCMGCAPVLAFAVAHPQMVASLVLYWPVGGARYRMTVQQRFADHLAYVDAHGLVGVVDLVEREGNTFNKDPRGGPWASVIHRDPAFAATYARLDRYRYHEAVTGMRRGLVDRDTAPGAEPEDLMRLQLPALIVPGRDHSHATSAARYLEECLPQAEYWDAPVEQQTEESVPPRLLEFLARSGHRCG